MSSQCRFLHDWGKWVVTQKGTLHPRDDDTKAIIGNYMEQQRICPRCGETQIKLSKRWF